ncbi:MAG: NRDE family protein [Reinekea sp.]|jgi:uncharacterized protein with NRDE domain
MCLAVIDWQPGTTVPLRVVANRDEFRNRATEPMHWWQDAPVLAGRDLLAGGSWLAFSKDGRFALLTNIRPGFISKTAPSSRGELVITYLSDFADIESFHEWLAPRTNQYGGFNLILGDSHRLFWCSSNYPDGDYLSTGIYGLSNDALDTPWPKVVQAKAQMQQYREAMITTLTDHGILTSTVIASDEQLPPTGLSTERERMLSAQTITSPDYGTRCRSHFIQHRSGRFEIAEQQINSEGDTVDTRSFLVECET